MVALRHPGTEERPVPSIRTEIVHSEKGLGWRRPRIHPDAVGRCRKKWIPVGAQKRNAVLTQDLCRASEIRQLFRHPVRPPGPHDVELGAVPVEERHGNLAVYPPLCKLDHAEDGKVRLDELVHVQRRGHVDCVVHSPRNNARHVFRDSHPFTVHHDARLHAVCRTLEFPARLSPGIEHHTVGLHRTEHLLHPGKVVLPARAFIPRIIGNEIARPVGLRKTDLPADLLESAGKVTVHVPLISLIDAKPRPGGPYHVRLKPSDQRIPLREKCVELVLTGQRIVIVLIPRELEHQQIAFPDPRQIGTLEQRIVK